MIAVGAAIRAHLVAHTRALIALEHHADQIEAWGTRLADVLMDGGRLLVAGNGGSSAEAQHLAGELVGRYLSERQPLAAIALTADAAGLTAIANDYGWEQALARQVVAHGRPGDVLMALSTSGESANVLEAVRVAHRLGIRAWGLTGPAPNPVHRLCDEAVAVPGTTPLVQEVHLVAIHLLCRAVEAEVELRAERELARAMGEAT